MLKEALQYIIGMSAPTIQEIRGETYSDKPLHRINYYPKAEPIKMNTLSSLIEYLKAGIDIPFDACYFIHVQSPTKVSVFSPFLPDKDRECLVEVTAQIPTFDFGRFIDHETFCINLQSKFLNDSNTDRALLLKFAGTVEAGTVAEYGDDGVTQKATVKMGIASKGEAIIPSPAFLRPFRTFVEVEQPESSFIFRMNQDRGSNIQCALFEADGGEWKNRAMENIKTYLREALCDYPNFIVIS
jgi:hypothetical protein